MERHRLGRTWGGEKEGGVASQHLHHLGPQTRGPIADLIRRCRPLIGGHNYSAGSGGRGIQHPYERLDDIGIDEEERRLNVFEDVDTSIGEFWQSIVADGETTEDVSGTGTEVGDEGTGCKYDHGGGCVVIQGNPVSFNDAQLFPRVGQDPGHAGQVVDPQCPEEGEILCYLNECILTPRWIMTSAKRVDQPGGGCLEVAGLVAVGRPPPVWQGSIKRSPGGRLVQPLRQALIALDRLESGVFREGRHRRGIQEP